MWNTGKGTSDLAVQTCTNHTKTRRSSVTLERSVYTWQRKQWPILCGFCRSIKETQQQSQFFLELFIKPLLCCSSVKVITTTSLQHLLGATLMLLLTRELNQVTLLWTCTEFSSPSQSQLKSSGGINGIRIERLCTSRTPMLYVKLSQSGLWQILCVCYHYVYPAGIQGAI